MSWGFCDGYLCHLHWGGRLPNRADDMADMLRVVARASFSATPDPAKPLTTDGIPLEYPVYGTGDMRIPALQARFADGSSSCELLYSTHRVLEGKPALEGLPAVYSEAGDEVRTLEIDLVEPAKALTVTLSYSVFTGFDAITRTVRVTNSAAEPVSLLGVSSAALDFSDGVYEGLMLQGSWARERHMERFPVGHGVKLLESRRGHSSHEMNPFFALLQPHTTERAGDAYGFSLVYTGSFTAAMEGGSYGSNPCPDWVAPFRFFMEAQSG